MKKCPYCKTLTNDDVNMCPNCLHDISSINPMPDAVSKKYSYSFYMIIFGILISIGSLVAMLSQKTNMINYYNLYKDSSLSQTEIDKYYQLFVQARFEMNAMFIFIIIGLALLILGVVFFIKKVLKEHKNK